MYHKKHAFRASTVSTLVTVIVHACITRQQEVLLMAGSEGEAGAGHSAGKHSAAQALASAFHLLMLGHDSRHSKGAHII